MDVVNETCRIAVIGFSNTAYRTALCLADSGIPVLFVIAEEHIRHADPLPALVEILSVARLRPDVILPGFEKCSAAIAASDDEQFNLHVTMQLFTRFPGMKIVTRLFNLGLGRELETRLAGVKALSVSDRAAPFFAASAFLDNVVEASRDKDRLLVKTGAIGSSKNIILPDDNEQPCDNTDENCNSRPSWKLNLDRMLVAVLLGIVCVITAGTLFFWLRHGIPPGDALYFVVTTLTTTGYGDYSLREYPFSAKLAGMTLMLLGATLFAILFALMTDKLFRMRLDALMGRRQVRKSGHVIVCGAGDVGIRIVECLRICAAETVVVERNQEGRFNQLIRELGIPLIISDATLAETLERAAVSQARAIICATDNDMRNLEVALNARSLNPGIRIVVRAYQPDFADDMRDHFGVEAALSSSAIAARYFADAALSR